MVAIFGMAIAACAGRTLEPAVVSNGSALSPPVLHLSLDKNSLEQLRRAAAPALTKAPDPLPVVHTAGVLPTTEAFKRAVESRRDWQLMSDLASLFAATSEQRYLARYEQYLSAWLSTYRISGNPIDETNLSLWMLAYRVAGGALPLPIQARMRIFACDLSARYQQRQPPERTTSSNNWQSHRVKLAAMGAFVCGDSRLIDRAITAFKDQIRDNLLPTGEAIDFFERDAIHYVVYSVEPLLETALFSELNGKPLFDHVGPQGQSLSRTLEWIAPYARGDKSHQEFARSKVRFDAERAAAGVPGYSGPFDPRKARYAYWLASRLESRWSDLSLQLEQPWVTQRAPWLAQ
jgi:Alginate lyase